MLTYELFVKSIQEEQLPENLPQTLKSLWWDKKGDWDKAHSIAQEILTVQGSAVHAYLHRREGVMWNADYWYKKAGRPWPSMSLDREWQNLVEEMLA